LIFFSINTDIGLNLSFHYKFSKIIFLILFAALIGLSLITIYKKFLCCDISESTLFKRPLICSSLSVPRFLILFSSSSLEGGAKKIEIKSLESNFKLISLAPLTSTSRKALRPESIIFFNSELRLPYLLLK
jgi:hypothetical protein